MATNITARQQLSRDIRDYFTSATTAVSGGATLLVDDRLIDEDDDRFVTEQSTVWVEGGQVGGPVLDEERAISSKSTNTITAKRAFSVTLPSTAVNYEVHRLFKAEEKDEAINVALDHAFPILWAHLSVDITTVADQFDYDISAHGFGQNLLNQVSIVSDGDTEVDFNLFAWEMRGSKLHLKQRIQDGKTLRLLGIAQPTLADIDQPQLQILTSIASIYLLEGTIMNSVVDNVDRWERSLSREQARFIERVRRHRLSAPPSTARSEAYDHSILDFNFFAK